jgi:DNA-binding MarR family transcriptional regulator
MSAPSFLRGLGYPVEKPEVGAEALYGIVWLASRAQKEAAKVLKAFRLTPAKFNGLMIVKHVGRKEGLSQREIGQRLLIDPGNVTHLLDDLEHRGWIERAAGPDRRSHRIKITLRGDRLLNEAWPAYKAWVDRLASGLTPQNKRRLVVFLSRWREALEGERRAV